MKKTTKAIALILVLIMSLSLVGCGKKAPEATTVVAETSEAVAPAAEQTKFKVGFSARNLNNSFIKLVSDAVCAEAEKYADEIDFSMTDAQGDVNTQISQLETMVADGCDLIILIPEEAVPLAPVVEEITADGIPVVIVNAKVDTDKYTTQVVSQDYDAGCMQGQFLEDTIGLEGPFNFCMLYGVMGTDCYAQRKAGIEDSWISKANCTMLADKTASWLREDAMHITEDWILSFPEMNLIIAQNDDMALGAIDALEAAGKLEDVVVIGVDATQDAVNAVKEGKLDCTVFQNAEAQGIGAVTQAMKILRGEDFEKDVYIPFELVVKDNVDNYIK